MLAALLLFSVCAHAQEAVSTDSTACTSQICELSEALAPLNLANSLSDLESNLKLGDRRFIGISGYICFAPGAEEVEELIEKATRYARVYNLEPMRRIRAGLI